MTWTLVTTGVEWSRASFIGEYVAAMNERAWAAGGGAYWSGAGLADPGTVIGTAAFWSNMQSALRGLAQMFVNSHDYPGGFAGMTSVPLYTTETWTDAAGLHYDADHPEQVFPRVPTHSAVDITPGEGVTTIAAGENVFVAGHVGAVLDLLGVGRFTIASVESPTDCTVTGDATGYKSLPRPFSVLPQDWTDIADPAFLYGDVQAGDVIGPWIFYWLQQGLNVLLWTSRPGYPASGWTQNEELNGRLGTGGDAHYADALAAARANFDDPGANPQAFGEYGWAPHSDGGWTQAGLGGWVTVGMSRVYGYAMWDVPADAADIHRDIDIYYYGDHTGFTVWHAQGDPWPAGYTEGNYLLLETIEDATGTSGVGSTACGSCADIWTVVPPGPPALSYSQGWTATVGAAVCRWQFEYA